VVKFIYQEVLNYCCCYSYWTCRWICASLRL